MLARLTANNNKLKSDGKYILYGGFFFGNISPFYSRRMVHPILYFVWCPESVLPPATDTSYLEGELMLIVI
jgi:hypothetical protein